MRQGSRILKNIDWVTIALFVVLCVCGWLTIFSVAYNPEFPSPFEFSMEYGKQFFWILVCSIIGILILNVEGNIFSNFAWPVYGFVILLLILVLILGKEVNGAKAWFRIGSIGIQPAEFAKFATSLVLAKFLGQQNIKLKSFATRAKVAFIVFLPIGFIMLQPDVGSALVSLAYIFALYREGLSGNILIIGLGAIFVGVLSIIMSYSTIDYPFIGEESSIWMFMIFILVVGLLSLVIIRASYLPRYRRKAYQIAVLATIATLIFSFASSWVIRSDKLLKTHHKQRIELLLGLADEKLQQRKGYNMKMAKTAIGSGGLIGKGYMDGPMTRYNFVPEQSTDFIFTSVCEEWGFLGAGFVLSLLLFLILRMIYLAERQRSRFSRIFGYCVASLFFLHFLINIGMVIGLAPVIGIPLPFFSYGGSSLLGFSLLIFTMLRLDAERFSVLR